MIDDTPPFVDDDLEAKIKAAVEAMKAAGWCREEVVDEFTFFIDEVMGEEEDDED